MRRRHGYDAWHESNLYFDRERAALAWAESLSNISTTRAPDELCEQARLQFSENGGYLDRNRDDQCLEPALDRHARRAPIGYGEGGIAVRSL